ncbi:family 43 glycosylhydrolase [Pelagicoccus albus]|uniref:Family 43 glycosylhydrolase n=2 Tax=Pelagicoccus albus TaxID=415222 RepID=A0A7X1B8C2_9BACT|nr:family 43 glycosylhydrolase [Pelagicoccus albus]
MPLHDPFIVPDAETETYYLFTSNIPSLSGTVGRGTMAYKSKDLKNWDMPKAVFVVPENEYGEEGAWAPEVHEYKGKYYLFTTVHNSSQSFKEAPDVPYSTYPRGTIVAVSESLDGPFEMRDKTGPLPPKEFMTLDGTLFIDEKEEPWLVYAHEWIQRIDGTMEAIKLSEDLSQTIGDPIHLFKASDAPWLNGSLTPSTDPLRYVTDGPQLFRTKKGRLLMLWSSYENDVYVQTLARSKSGNLQGPWEQLDPLVKHDSGHGMLFETFEGELMMVLHRPFKNAKGKLYSMRDTGDRVKIVRERTDLDFESNPTH